jgi:hypothetical protein
MLELEGKIELEISGSDLDYLADSYILDSLNEWLSDNAESSLSFANLSASSKKALWGEITKRVLGEN